MPTTETCLEHNESVLKKCLEVKEGEWIVGGNYGSREAVLVFRTNILNPKTRTSMSSKSSIQSLVKPPESKSADKSTTYDESSKLPVQVDFPLLHKCESNVLELTEKKPVSGFHARQRKIFVSVKKTIKSNKNETRNEFSHLLNSLSSSEISISSEEPDIKRNTSTSPTKWSKNIQNVHEDIQHETDYKSSKPNNLIGSNIENPDDGQDCDSEEYKECGLNMPAYQLKMTYKFQQTETKLLRKIFNVHGLTEVHGDEHFNILWTGVHMKLDILRNLAPYQRVNHFPRSYELTRKDRLYKNIERMQHLRGMRHFDIVPHSFILPLEYKDLVIAHNKHRGPWIVKPAASSRGRGIFIVNSPDQIPQDEQVLVSKYIMDPLCIDGHKCDLRVYVLVTSFDPLIIYIYEEGIVRIATVKYDRNADSLWNPCMHLCNYSINKYHSDYIKSSDAHDEDVGHKWTLSALLRHLKLQGCDIRRLMHNIEDLIIKSILACAQTIISACRMFVPNGNNCFELYGFDILIDDSLKPWLLEVNLSPSMGVDSPLDTKVKASLITDLLTCVGIPAYGPEMRSQYDSKWSRFRNISCPKRVNSTEGCKQLHTSRAVNNKKGKKVKLVQLTLEEQRIIRNARFQYGRRGGFVRIFPTQDTLQRYGNFLDPSSGIPISTTNVQGQTFQSLVMPHNYNVLLHSNLFCKGSRCKDCDNCQTNRMRQYERALETDSEIPFVKKQVVEKCEEERKRLRKQILKLIGNGSELTQFQARQTFSLYLETLLKRLTIDPKDSHEKIVLKFLNRYGGVVKPPILFRNPQNMKAISKARSAMVAKLLGDFLELYKRETEAYVDSFDHFGMIPSNLFSEFLSQAQEGDLADVLTLHTNLTGIMPYLYNRCGLSVPPTPPIPSGLHGFLRALPAMVSPGAGARELCKYDGYFRSFERDCENLHDISIKTKSTRKF